MKLAKNFSINSTTYASQGNAVLGIRDSGKTYTATAIAEKLLDDGIPFVAFDPIGVWRYLKYGVNGKKGYAIVVAGDNADLPLTVESAPKIIRAAMQENIPLVLDLYSMKLSKADWKRIVQSCLEILLYENKVHGLRHIFIEEAAEFCPQRVGPDSGRVYAEVEKLARMGGNASLGYTLINQRAEEVNKAVLELCDCLFLHRQKGRHSLTALGKWLDVADAEGSREIIKSLPMMPQGECWVWEQGSQQPKHIKVLPKKTVHPDRRNPLKVSKLVPSDVSKFLVKLNKSLVKEIPKSKVSGVIQEIAARNTSKPMAEIAHYDPREEVRMSRRGTTLKEIQKWPEDEMPDYGRSMDNHVQEGTINKLRHELAAAKQKIKRLESVIEGMKSAFGPQYKAMKKLFSKIDELEPEGAVSADWQQWLDKLNGKNRDMLQALIDNRRLTKQQLGFKISMSHSSGSFATYLSKLKSLGLVEKDGEFLVLANVQ
jgi:hypothetical protein